LSYRIKKKAFYAVALAARFREDLSAIALLKKSGIGRPNDLDGRSYASYIARYEDQIVAQLVKNDGGHGRLKLAYPEKLGICNTLLSGRYDATWIFMNWEGIHAESVGVSLRTIKKAHYGIPYAYSPILLRSRRSTQNNKSSYDAFLRATKRGFLYAQEHPGLAVECLAPYIMESDKDVYLFKSQEYANHHYGNEENWGRLEEEGINPFLEWFRKQGLECSGFEYKDLEVEGLL
jgi:ABC-type nitrate/sulfonate/bicarbonate transport system substrate-binding protein